MARSKSDRRPVSQEPLSDVSGLPRTPRFIYPAVYETSEDIIARGPTSFFDTCASAVSDILNISLCSPLFVVEFDLQCVGYTTELTVHPCSCQMCRGGELMVKLDEQVY